MNSFFVKQSVISLFIGLFISGTGYPLFPSFSVSIFYFSLMLFVFKLNKEIPIRELTLLVASIQLLVSSFFAFYVFDPDPTFLPEGNPDTYFSFAIPSILAFAGGLFFFKAKSINQKHLFVSLRKYNLFEIGKKLIISGWIAAFVRPFLPGSIAYFATLIVTLSYIGAIIIFYSDIARRKKQIYIGLAFLPVVSDALNSGVFYLAMIWGTYFILYVLYRKKFSFTKNLIIIILGVYLIFVLDSAKKDYRELNSSAIGNQMSSLQKGTTFSILILRQATFDALLGEANISGRVTRANQGAIVTWVMNYTPRIAPFAEGETIKNAIISAIFPRFLMPNKAEAGGRVNYERFTGRTLNSNTSINISLLGEAWANFGYYGGIFLMFVIGCFYSFILKVMTKLFKKHPIYFFFIPFVLLLTIKAEDDVLTPLNHIVKASFVLYLLHRFYLKKIIRRGLSKERI